ncbi:MAG: BLUF domain-containing protein [Methylomonas sp.]|jgi:uncharacterized protein YaaQ
MIYLIYISSASKRFSEDELVDLLSKSREKNTKLGVTGMLLYKDGNFLQVLEGEETAVMKLFGAIKANSNHQGVTILDKGELAERQFGDWSMGFRNLNDQAVQSIPGFSPYMNASFTAEEFESDPAGTLALLKLFRQNM